MPVQAPSRWRDLATNLRHASTESFGASLPSAFKPWPPPVRSDLWFGRVAPRYCRRVGVLHWSRAPRLAPSSLAPVGVDARLSADRPRSTSTPFARLRSDDRPRAVGTRSGMCCRSWCTADAGSDCRKAGLGNGAFESEAGPSMWSTSAGLSVLATLSVCAI
eukprot:761763-Rhodomonas_salina.2